MSRIATTFETLKREGRAALVGFVTAGDPDLDTSEKIVRAMCDAGLDLLELGIPFSDPVADGPVIQRGSQRALAAGTTIEKVLEMTARLRQHTQVPIVLFGYYNPIHAMGAEVFCQKAQKVGADGMLIVDLPPEEIDDLKGSDRKNSLDLIRLIAPTTPDARMAKIAGGASGFLYLVSKTGVTGSAGLEVAPVNDQIQRLRLLSGLPICVGFGISTPADAAAIAGIAEGVVIGTAFERMIEENLNDPQLPDLLGQQVARIRNAMDNAE